MHTTRERRLSTASRQRGQAVVEYLVGTVFFVLGIAFVADPSLFGVNVDLLQAVKDFFKAFSYAVSVAAT